MEGLGYLLFGVLLCGYFIYKALKSSTISPGSIKLQYLGGIPDVKGPKIIALTESSNFIEFEGIIIYKKDITDIKLAPRSVIGGAAGGAALGAMVAGPIGALIGGAAVAGSPGASKVLQLSYSKNSINYELFFADADIINKYPLVQQLVRGD